MMLIAWQNGAPVFRSGAVGTGQGCCCKSCAQHPLCCQLFISWPEALIVDNAGVLLEKDGSGCPTGRVYAFGSATFMCSGGGGCTFQWRAYFTATLFTQGSCYKFQAGSLVFDDFVVVSIDSGAGCACPNEVADERTDEAYIIYAACS